jgi:hypothetical protein
VTSKFTTSGWRITCRKMRAEIRGRSRLHILEIRMSQVLNILRKDIRRLRPEILLVLAGTIAFVWVRRSEGVPAASLEDKEVQNRFVYNARPHLCLQFVLPYWETFSVNPVILDNIDVGNSGIEVGKSASGAFWEMRGTLCPGTEVAITTLRPGERILRDIYIHGIRPVDYMPRYAR